MRPTNESTLGELITEMIRAYGLQDGIRLEQIRTAWEQTMPPAVLQRTDGLSFNGGVLKARMNSAVVRNELQLIREEIRQELNSKLRDEPIRELVIF